jgi:hypothetical protein
MVAGETQGLLSFSVGGYQEKYFDIAGASFENRS